MSKVSAVLRPLPFLLFLLAGGIHPATLRAELTDEQKKELFKKTHSSPSPSPSPGKHPQGSGSKKHSSPGHHPSSTASPSPHSKKKTSPSSSKAHTAGNPLHQKSAGQGKDSPSSGTSLPATTTPAHDPAAGTGHPSDGANPPTSLPLPHGATPSAITIEKSGVEADQGIEPVPAPAPQSDTGGGFWSRLFGPARTYTYLSGSTRAAIDRAPVRHGRWKYIVVHNSGTREGNARVFDIYHLRVRHMKNGLAYHFVIGDGHGSGDGQIEIGHRWTAQLNGGHVASDYLNDIALGICLVGDFNRDQPTKAQIGALEELVDYLRNRVGKSQGRKAIIYAHKEINPRPTDCPGDRFPYGWLHAKFGNNH